MDKDFSEPKPHGYAETNTKTSEDEKIEANAPKAPLFRSGIGKKIASTLTKAGDKAEELRVKKQYLNEQLNRITGGPIKLNPKQKLSKTNSTSNIKHAKHNQYRPKHIKSMVIIQKPRAQKKTRAQRTPDTMSDLIHGDKLGNTNSHVNDLVFGDPKKNGKRSDPFKGLLG